MDNLSSPYDGLTKKAFWSKTAALRDSSEVDGFYVPKFRISQDQRIATAGSCFAQHFGRTLNEAGYKIIDEEPLPPIIPRAIAQKYGYRMYSGRYGNIYTVRQLLQLLKEALNGDHPEERVWERRGRYFDAQRPNVEPGGLDSHEDVLRHRDFHLSRIRMIIQNVDVFVFTFGLTEVWCSSDRKTVFPTAPGTIAGTYDPEKYLFHNFRFSEIRKDFDEVRTIIRELRPNVRFLVTVSPVPLTATASSQHVEVATSRSKATLRAVCAEIYDDYDDVDYYPSYEIITAQVARGTFFKSNMRTVRDEGVSIAMKGFLSAQCTTTSLTGGSATFERPTTEAAPVEDEVACEEALLEEFAPK